MPGCPLTSGARSGSGRSTQTDTSSSSPVSQVTTNRRRYSHLEANLLARGNHESLLVEIRWQLRFPSSHDADADEGDKKPPSRRESCHRPDQGFCGHGPTSSGKRARISRKSWIFLIVAGPAHYELRCDDRADAMDHKTLTGRNPWDIPQLLTYSEPDDLVTATVTTPLILAPLI